MTCNILHDLRDQLAWHAVLAGLTGRTVVDVGANYGAYTDLFLAHGASRVIAVEPGPRLGAGLRERFAGNARVVVCRQGLSDAPGRLEGVRFHNCWTLARPGSLGGPAGAISPEAEGVEGAAPFDVELTTLDALVDELGVTELALCKIDVDGFEPRVLRGARRTLAIFRPVVHLELSYIPRDLGESIPAFVEDIYRQGYVITSLGGRPETAAEVLEHWPWNTSFDVLLMPR